MFTKAFFILAPNLKDLKCPSTWKWRKKKRWICIHKKEQTSDDWQNMDEPSKYYTQWNRIQKYACYIFPLIWNWSIGKLSLWWRPSCHWFFWKEDCLGKVMGNVLCLHIIHQNEIDVSSYHSSTHVKWYT